MPIDVPKEDKVYTTVYDNFKGVDFTNDASNVYKRRSPSGLNMLPDLDGRPYKRKGWDIEITAQQFRAAAGVESSVPVTPDRMHYFEVGSTDYIIFFNNLGVFSYCAQDGLVYHDKYVSIAGSDTSFPSDYQPDGRRSFFFEGKGTAGFYTFVGINLYRFDGKRFYEVAPHIPIIFRLCDPDGSGTAEEDANILTDTVISGFACDGQSVKYVLPGGASAVLEVKVRTEDGWDVLVPGADKDYTVESGVIVFPQGHPPAQTMQGEDNMLVKYNPDASSSALSVDTTTESNTVAVTKMVTKRRTRKKKSDSWPAWKTVGNPSYKFDGASFSVSNVAMSDSEKNLEVEIYDKDTETWSTLNKDNYSIVYDAYGNAATVSPNESLFDSQLLPDSTSDYIMAKTDHPTEQEKVWNDVKIYKIRIKYKTYRYPKEGSEDDYDESKEAFVSCSRVAVYGSGIINQVFLTGSNKQDYNTRVWYSASTDPSYFPDLNYFEVGATDKPIMGLIKVGEYLGVVKKSESLSSSIYLAYPTTFDETTAYAVKQSVNGIGAIANGAFNVLLNESLFLSKEGVMGIDETANESERQTRNRSFYVNKKLCAEENLNGAVSIVYDGMYWLAVNTHCYVLDGSQKTSWENTKTNLQYEAYYLENVPAQCFAKLGDQLWFTDFDGNVCRFMTDSDEEPYHDGYDCNDPVHEIPVGGVPIRAVWSTIADDDGAVHFFKNLQKKGNVVSLLPSSDSGVKVYIKADNNEPLLVGVTDVKDYQLPYDMYIRKKIKKYKRLQFICENDAIGDSFGLDQIIKSYTMGNYSKNKG